LEQGIDPDAVESQYVDGVLIVTVVGVSIDGLRN